MKFKYIIFQTKNQEVDILYPIIFSGHIVHSDMAASTRHMLQMKYGMEAEAISAGFITLNNMDNPCYGESISLKLKSRGQEDSKIISTYHITHGIM
jgi:hypothetical protein